MTPRLRKAAVLISALDTREADRLLEQMGEHEAQRVRDAVIDLGDVPQAEQEAVLAEFFGRSRAPAKHESPRAEETGVRLELSASSREQASSRSAVDSPLRERFTCVTFERVAPVAAYLDRQHPQLAAVVISHLEVELAAAIVRSLSRSNREEILNRLEDLDEVDPAVLDDLERDLVRAIPGARGSKRSAFLGEIRKRLDERTSSNSKESVNPKAAEAIPERTPPLDRPVTPTVFTAPAVQAEPNFRFDDLLKLSDRTFRRVFHEADPRYVMPALAGASRAIFERYAALLSPERAAEFERHLEQLRPLRLSDIDTAQRELARIADRLLESAKSAAKKLRESVAVA